jgi:biotin/methionine sulfoxide reductase
MPSVPLSSSHWGAFQPIVEDGRLVDARPFAEDPDPSRIIASIPDGVRHQSRVTQPAVREGWLKHGPGRANDGRGGDKFVSITWERALDLIANELRRVIDTHGNHAIFGGSYGWGSAGRFHHASSQLKRFLGAIGGFVNSRETYSTAAGSVLVKNVVGTFQAINGPGTSWQTIVDHTKLVMMFGGLPIRNTRDWIRRAKDAGVEFINISPLRDDAAEFLDAPWLAPRPHSDTAIALALAHTLVVEELHDSEFLARCCSGFDRFRDYLLGRTDGVAKDAAWAERLSEIPADEIRSLARRMARERTFIVANWSLQRADHGEQPFWALIALASMLGQVGLPGGGFGFGYGSMEGLGGLRPDVPTPTIPLTHNPVADFIPVARIADLLLNPDAPFQYNGMNLTYPDIRLVYWCGGNPFHHHQDLNRLIRAWRRPDTVIVNEPFWTATARHSDIVLPSTIPLERNDIGAAGRDRYWIAMKQAISPIGQARSDFDIFADLADRFDRRALFTEERSEMEWVRYLYETASEQAAGKGVHCPPFDEFWERGYFAIPETERPVVLLEKFRRDPERNRLATASGRIEIFSDKIAGWGYDDCLGHPAWIEPAEWLGSDKAARFPLHLLTSQPASRLHGQMDMGRVSRETKVHQREPIRMNPHDARVRSIRDGDVVRVFNDRGAMLAGAVVTDAIRPGVVQVATGAWFDPVEPGVIGSMDKHGNPNVLTLDKGTSKLAQGPSAQTALVEVEKFEGELPPITAYDPPLL